MKHQYGKLNLNKPTNFRVYHEDISRFDISNIPDNIIVTKFTATLCCKFNTRRAHVTQRLLLLAVSRSPRRCDGTAIAISKSNYVNRKSISVAISPENRKPTKPRRNFSIAPVAPQAQTNNRHTVGSRSPRENFSEKVTQIKTLVRSDSGERAFETYKWLCRGESDFRGQRPKNQELHTLFHREEDDQLFFSTNAYCCHEQQCGYSGNVILRARIDRLD